MAIVIISCVDEKTRRELGERLAQKLDCPALSREELVDRATQSGVPVGRLEVAVLKHCVSKERLAQHKLQYLAFGSVEICDRSRESANLVYHGRAGNMLLQGVSHVLRVRVVPNAEQRLASTIERLKLDRDKAIEYITKLDDDVANWVRFAHGVDINDPRHCDLMLNLDQISLSSACATACTMAQLPEFQSTPASRRVMADLCLAARARSRLGQDERTAWADLNVSARDGRITITYMPGQAQVGGKIESVLSGLDGARELVVTMAVSNLFWVAECFEPSSRAYAEVTDLARRWGAAVQLGRLIPPDDASPVGSAEVDGRSAEPEKVRYVPKAEDVTGGIEEDVPASSSLSDGGLAITAEALIDGGIFGGSRLLAGGAEQVVAALKTEPNYSLVVIGEVFVAKGESSRVRLTRELCAGIQEGTRIPVLGSSELRQSFLFDKRQILWLVSSLLAVAGIYALVFSQQKPILDFLGGPDWHAWRVAATLAVALTVPLVAYLYGGATDLFLKWLKFE